MDAMAIVRVFGKPTLFVTITCNPKWPEIADALLPGQKPEDRPDLVARVFHQKLKRIVKDITKDGVFGKASANMRVIEFQKRGESTMPSSTSKADPENTGGGGPLRL